MHSLSTVLFSLFISLGLSGVGLASAGSANPPCDFHLPTAVTSFGAEGLNDRLLVYSGHVGRTHAHSASNLSGSFVAIDCAGEPSALPMRDSLQGTALVAHDEGVILVGGLQAFNVTADEDEDLVSTAAVRRFGLRDGVWRDLPPLPQPRSSHDAVVLDGILYVVGGWNLRGKGVDPIWADDTLTLDLRAPSAWSSIEQPFQRRALAVTHDGARLIVVGGLDSKRSTSRRVDVYDPAEDLWTQGPQLPLTEGLKGFGSAAEHFEGRAVVSIADGSVLVLEANGAASADTRWHKVAQLEVPRFFHELAVVDGRLYAVGGSSTTEHLSSVELVNLAVDVNLGAVNPNAGSPDAENPEPASSTKELPPTAWAGFRHAVEQPGVVQLEQELWRTRLEGYGQSAPVVLGARVFVTSTTGPNLEQQHLAAYDLTSGKRLWLQTLSSSEQFESSDMIARAAPTPVVDQHHVYAFFGSGDVAAFRHDGALSWKRDLVGDYGSFAGNHGVASSAVRTDSALVLQVARKTYAYVLALDLQTGKTLWKTDRKAGPGWTTPALSSDGTEIVVGVSDLLEGFDSKTGVRRWSVSGLGGNSAPSPLVVDGGIGVATTRNGGFTWFSYLPGAEPTVRWKSDFTGHFSSPALAADCLLVSNSVGAMVCFDPSTGAEHWRQRVAGAIWSTPIVDSAGHLVTASEKGHLQVFDVTASGAELKYQRDLGLDGRAYGIAAVNGLLLVRTGSELIAIR